MVSRDRGLEACHRVREQTDTVVLKFSLGKDSVACWLRLREIFPNIVPIYHYWIPGLEFVERDIAIFEEYFSTKIRQIPHPNFLNYLARGDYQPPHRAHVCAAFDLKTIGYDLMISYVCEDWGIKNYWVATGIKASDSPIRQIQINKQGAWAPSKKLFYPVADMLKADLIELFKKHNCPISDNYRVFGRSFDGFQYRYLAKIKEYYPADYQKIIRYFPLVEAEFTRKEANDAQAKKLN